MRNLITSAVMSALVAEGAGGSVNVNDATVANSAAEAAVRADEAAKVGQKECGRLALKVLKTDVKSAANTSEGIFSVFQASEDWMEADVAIQWAENRLMEEFKVKSMAELCRVSGVKQFSYVTIRSTMLAAIRNAEDWVAKLTEYYQWTYDQLSPEDKAKNALETVPDGFLNPWSSRYSEKTSDEKPVTRFNRDRRLAQDSVSRLESLKKIHADAKKKADADAAGRLQTTMQSASAVADTAPAGSGGSVQGMASGSREASSLTPPVRHEFSLLTNAVHAAADILPDSVVVAALAECGDKIRSAIEQQRNAERLKASEAGRKPIGTLEATDDDVSDLPDLTPEDTANIADLEASDGPSAAEA